VEKLLVSAKPFYDNPYTMGMRASSQTAEQYTTNNHFKNNQIQIAGLLDSYDPIQPTLYSLNTQEQFEALIQSLLVAEVAADANNLSLYNPHTLVFNHFTDLSFNNSISSINSVNFSDLIRGQSTCSSPCTPAEYKWSNAKHEFWFEGYYRSENVSGNSNALGYKTSQGRMMIGVDKVISKNLMSGLVFSYGNPQVQHSVAKIEADDYTFGAYARLKLSEVSGIYANAFLGYGHQNYELRRNLTNSNAKYNGDSFYTSLELYKPIHFRNKIILSPLVAIDFQKAWSDGFNVNVTDLPLAVGKSDIDQTVLRIGVNSSYRNLRTRLQYGYQVGGDLYGVSPTSIAGGNNNRVLTGVNLGRNTLNLGFGGNFKIGKRTKLFADYDFDLGKHSTAHTGQFGFVTIF
jgi:outer membrane autotransporter protein